MTYPVDEPLSSEWIQALQAERLEFRLRIMDLEKDNKDLRKRLLILEGAINSAAQELLLDPLE